MTGRSAATIGGAGECHDGQQDYDVPTQHANSYDCCLLMQNVPHVILLDDARSSAR